MTKASLEREKTRQDLWKLPLNRVEREEKNSNAVNIPIEDFSSISNAIRLMSLIVSCNTSVLFYCIYVILEAAQSGRIDQMGGI